MVNIKGCMKEVIKEHFAVVFELFRWRVQLYLIILNTYIEI